VPRQLTGPARTALWALLLAAACARPPAAEREQPLTAPVPPRQPANVMSIEGADWLERPDRAEKEKPEVVLAAMRLARGDMVAEVGAGTGFFARRIAPLVAPGKVYAVDIQPEMLDLLRGYAERDGVAGNIVPVLGTETDPKLPRGTFDWVLMVDVYHELQQPRPMLQKIRESLAPGGRVALVEYRLEGESASHVNIRHRMSVEQVLAEWLPAGFELVERREPLPSQHLFVFRPRQKP
jgi:SAM-dependent methyltransferase